MKETEELILQEFKTRRIGKNCMLQFGSLHAASFSWGRRHLDNFETALASLIERGLLTQNGKILFLTETGYDYIYRDDTLDDSIQEVMAWIRSRNIGKNQPLSARPFKLVTADWSAYHRENVEAGLAQLTEEGCLSQNKQGIHFLTEEGYNQVYGTD
jgi:hypothetical protein